MQTTYTVHPIGVFQSDGDGASIILHPEYAPALAGLESFSHIQCLWWFSHCDTRDARKVLQEEAPYQGAPQWIGTFATRSPQRPNPIALTCAQILYIDHTNATIHIAYTDAENGSPVLDVKPYTPSLDRVESPTTPKWCDKWPMSLEASATFDWGTVFTRE